MWQDEIAMVYDAAAQRGITPRECDESEMWVLASALGANRPDDDDDPLADEDGYTWNQRRSIALARGEPEPQWEDAPMTAKEIADMQRLMGGIDPVPPPGLVTPSE